MWSRRYSNFVSRNFLVNDQLFWTADSSVKYTVKFLYPLYLEKFFNGNQYHVLGDWKRLWCVKVPLKVRNLNSRISRGCLQTRVRLQIRRIQCPKYCYFCEDGLENDLQVLVWCSFGRKVWSTMDNLLMCIRLGFLT